MVESLDIPEEQAVETLQTSPVPPLEPATATATVSEPIQGASSDLTISTNNAGISMVYYDGTEGWRLIYND